MLKSHKKPDQHLPKFGKRRSHVVGTGNRGILIIQSASSLHPEAIYFYPFRKFIYILVDLEEDGKGPA